MKPEPGKVAAVIDPDIAPDLDSDIIAAPREVRPERLLSIDVLRGLTIALMILVNDQAGPAPFPQLVHARWNGFTITDLVFPTFLFLIGLSTVLSVSSRLARGLTRKVIWLHALRRSILLIFLGFVVNNFPFFHLATARYYGVLPRIAICYLVVATLFLISRGWKDKAAIAVLCLAAYWVLMRFVPVPGYGVPTHAIPINHPDANLTAWIDRHIFSADHLYQHTRDPEGLLSTIPAVATALFGMLTGLLLRTRRSSAAKAAMLGIAAALLIASALAWNPYFPINKKLWTSSFALFAGGWSLLLLAVAIYLVDVLRIGLPTRAQLSPTSDSTPILYKPALVLGTNAILAYLISELGQSLLYVIHTSGGPHLNQAAFQAVSAHIADPAWASLIYSLCFLLLCWCALVPLYRRKLFFRL